MNLHDDAMNTQELYIDVTTAEATEELTDDTMWPSKMKKLEEHVKEHGASGGIFVHAGLATSTHAARDKGDRIAAALLLRHGCPSASAGAAAAVFAAQAPCL